MPSYFIRLKVLSINPLLEAKPIFKSIASKSVKIMGENIMSLEDRAKATAKNVEGKLQEAVGEVTGSPRDKAEGKAKQVEAEGRHAVEDMKDAVKRKID
ncbi:CsbD family protein [Oscillatoria sp. FACHB-1407]|uniref:CsbD family protein n=2 Tax=Oscillatoria sp. FACHB-1407 TaxID=2692847 RepID=UPI0035CCDFB3